MAPALDWLVRPLVALGLGLVLFGVVERVFGGPGRGAPWRRAAFSTDVGWWLLTPVVTRAITRVGSGVAIFVVAWASSGHPVFGKAALLAFAQRDTWASSLPLWIEVMLTLAAADLLGYWAHRAFHRGWLWRVHAVHHSSEHLDWLAAVRVHPLNDLLGGVARVALLVAFGFRPTVLAAIVPFLTLYGLVLHADVPWTFGPLGRVIASPVFHRFHHARDVEGDGVNFGGLFCLWDVVFGTFQMPCVGAFPPTGIREPMPSTLWGQLAFPFRRSIARPSST